MNVSWGRKNSSKSKQSVKFVDIFQTEWCDIYHTIIGEACHQWASLSLYHSRVERSWSLARVRGESVELDFGSDIDSWFFLVHCHIVSDVT